MSNQFDIAIYLVSKREVQQMKFGRIREWLKTLETTHANAECMSLGFDGYDDVVEEIYEIPEIRKWCAQLVQKFPHIFYYLEDQHFESRRNLILCLARIESKMTHGKYETVIKPISEYTEEEMLNRPQSVTVVAIDMRLYGNIVKKMVEYGVKQGDVDNTIRISTEMLSVFGKDNQA